MLDAMKTLIAFSLAAALCAGAAAQPLRAVPVIKDLQDPWALAFLPDGRMLITERAGRLRIAEADGRVSALLTGLPAVAATGQCGLLDVVLDPAFASNQRLFFTFAEPAKSGQSDNSTAVGRARLVGNQLVDVRTIFSQKPKVNSRLHCGSRIAFDRGGHLYHGNVKPLAEAAREKGLKF